MGQHITFYQPRTLKILAEKSNWFYYPLGKGFHLITDKHLSKVNQMFYSSLVLSILQALYIIIKQQKLSKTQLNSTLMKKKVK